MITFNTTLPLYSNHNWITVRYGLRTRSVSTVAVFLTQNNATLLRYPLAQISRAVLFPICHSPGLCLKAPTGAHRIILSIRTSVSTSRPPLSSVCCKHLIIKRRPVWLLITLPRYPKIFTLLFKIHQDMLILAVKCSHQLAKGAVLLLVQYLLSPDKYSLSYS